MSEYRLQALSLVLAQSPVPGRKYRLCFLIGAPEILLWACVLKVVQVDGDFPEGSYRLRSSTAGDTDLIYVWELGSLTLCIAAKKRKEKNRNSFLNQVKKIFKINKESKVACVKGVSRRKAQSQNPSLESHRL